jgi:putative aminopeptidase FrvX
MLVWWTCFANAQIRGCLCSNRPLDFLHIPFQQSQALDNLAMFIPADNHLVEAVESGIKFGRGLIDSSGQFLAHRVNSSALIGKVGVYVIQALVRHLKDRPDLPVFFLDPIKLRNDKLFKCPPEYFP